MSERKTIVIGAGVLGIAAAWELLSRGEAVQVVDSAADVAVETSYANGAMMTASMPDPWNGPGVFRHLAASIFNPHSPMKLRLRVIPSHAIWGIKFLRNSSPARHRQATKDIYRLAAYSVAETNKLREQLKLEYDASSVGTLKLFRVGTDMTVSRETSDMLVELGLRYTLLDADEVVALEPQLAAIKNKITGAIRYPDDEVGDARLFCLGVANAIRGGGGEIQLNTSVRKITTQGGAVSGVDTDKGWIAADRIVLAAGNGSAKLAGKVGLSLLIKPAKGYSVTMPRGGIEQWPRIPVLDDAMHAGIVPLGDRMRLVGTAEFTGYDDQLRKARVDNLFELLKTIYPETASRLAEANSEAWTGFRPMTVDGRPLIGAAGPTGLHLNTGHGHLGWTLALGSAKLLADQMLGAEPAIDPEPFQYKH